MEPRRQRWVRASAIAASLILAVGVAWNMQGAPSPSARPGTPIRTATAIEQAALVRREADMLTVQYQAALRELDAEWIHDGWQPGLDALDRSAAEIRSALQRDPNSRLLLERLRDTYTRRLALSRRAHYA